MTAEELKLTIELLRNQLKPLMKEYEIYKEATKNYEDLLNQAEGAFLKKEYLESFLIQSCIIEGILKEYAKKKLLPIISQSNVLKRKFENFEWARLTDELFVSGKIEKDLYEKLNNYRKKRNAVIHSLLDYNDKDKLDEELREVYESGKHMKGFIVDDMNKETAGGLTAAELDAQIEILLSQLKKLESQIVEIENKK